MAYADYTFYTNDYFGSVVPDTITYTKFAEKASDFLDTITFDRLVDGLPTDERAQKRIKKAVCALADVMYQLELAEVQALQSVQSGVSTETTSNVESNTGVVVSKSSGSESITYATPQQVGATAKEWSSVYTAAGDPDKIRGLLGKTALEYLANVRTDDGIPLLFAGV